MRRTEETDWAAQGWERLAPRAGRRRLPGWDCTVGLVVGDRAALLVDAGSTLREGAELREQTRRLLRGGPGRVREVTHVALTHAHFDHVMGASVFGTARVYGAAGIGAVLTAGREELRADAVRHGVAPDDAARAAEALASPGVEVTGSLSLDLGGLVVVLADVGPGHTRNDLAVLVPGEPAVVFCGDLVEESGEPQAGPDAEALRWPFAVDRLLGLGGAGAVYVPGHGAVVDAGFLREQRVVLGRLR
ncbi:MBL fold metallo-hydrolase [Streptomyces uncialis]|uniref:MBL fold metallo-hydrolase n=1 Tax=Streptomyces uncialis TaxID=1048205 RepID=UPI003655BDE9